MSPYIQGYLLIVVVTVGAEIIRLKNGMLLLDIITFIFAGFIAIGALGMFISYLTDKVFAMIDHKSIPKPASQQPENNPSTKYISEP